MCICVYVYKYVSKLEKLRRAIFCWCSEKRTNDFIIIERTINHFAGKHRRREMSKLIFWFVGNEAIRVAAISRKREDNNDADNASDLHKKHGLNYIRSNWNIAWFINFNSRIRIRSRHTIVFVRFAGRADLLRIAPSLCTRCSTLESYTRRTMHFNDQVYYIIKQDYYQLERDFAYVCVF